MESTAKQIKAERMKKEFKESHSYEFDKKTGLLSLLPQLNLHCSNHSAQEECSQPKAVILQVKTGFRYYFCCR